MKRTSADEPVPADSSFARRLPAFRLLSALVISVAIIVCCLEQIQRKDGDPDLFVHAARLLLHGQDIYAVANQHGILYLYPPFFAFLNIPLTPLPAAVVIVLWSICSVAAIGWSIAAFYGGMTGQPFFSHSTKTRWVICFFTSLLIARPAMLHLRFGSSNPFILAIAVLGLVQITRGQRVRGGIALGLSMVVKLTTVPFGFLFLARPNRRVLAGLVLGGLLGVMAPALIVGPVKDASYHREWIAKVALSNAPGTGNWAGIGNISLRAQLDRFFLRTSAFIYKGIPYRVTLVELSPSHVRAIGHLTMLVVALAIGLYVFRFRNAPALVSQWGAFAFVFSLIPNFSTVAGVPHLILLAPAYLYVVHFWYARGTTNRTFRILVVLSFIFTTLTTKTFCGQFVGSMLTSLGFINWGMLMLSAAIFKAGTGVTTKAEAQALT
jgi:hypothetical protein